MSDLEVDDVELNERQRALRDKFIEARGYWTPFWDGLLGLDPEFFESYLAFSSVPWKTGPLAPKIKELIYTAHRRFHHAPVRAGACDNTSATRSDTGPRRRS